MVRIGKRLARCGLAAALTLMCVETAACMSGRIMRARGLFYEEASYHGLSSYLAERDPVVGWPAPRSLGKGDTDASGSRIVPAFADPSRPACATIYGDSFAYSEEVDAEHAWGNVLAERVRCRVTNFGVPGYGTDQAYLRYARNKADRAPVAILSQLSENIVRNVNRFRALLYPGNAWGFKPRFIADEKGGIALVPIPSPSTDEELHDIVAAPERHLEHEYFVLGGPAGTARLSFPYTLSMVRAAKNWRLRAGLAGEPSHAAFYEPTHPARGLEVSAGIAEAFAREARARGASPFVVLIPLPSDFVTREKHGRFPYAPLLEKLERAGIPHLDAGEQLWRSLGDRDPCSLYRRCSGGHFNEEGYRLLAEIVHAFLDEHGAP